MYQKRNATIPRLANFGEESWADIVKKPALGTKKNESQQQSNIIERVNRLKIQMEKILNLLEEKIQPIIKKAATPRIQDDSQNDINSSIYALKSTKSQTENEDTSIKTSKKTRCAECTIL